MSIKPNIVLIMTDQQRPDALGCYGNKAAQTPNIDHLAQQGVTFDNCYVQNPLCCPSRYSLLTGRYPHCHRVRSNWFAPREGETSFGHQLKRAGYSTAMIGKMHLTPWYDCFGFDGRIIAESKFHNCPDDYESFLNKNGTSRVELDYEKDSRFISQCSAIKSKLPQELHIDSFVGRSTCEYLQKAKEPFCLFTSFLSPHNPYDPPEPYDKLFENVDLTHLNFTEGEVERKPKEVYNYMNSCLRWPFKTDELTKKQVQLMRSHYYSLCTLIDDWVGRIIEILKTRKIFKNTVIIYTSDHGDLLGDHGLLFKQNFYEQSVRVPLIFHAPSLFEPRRVNSIVEAIDLYRTFCDLADTEPGKGTQGMSLLPLLTGYENYKHKKAAFSENFFGRMIRFREFKMIYYVGKPYGELYNLDKDPDEQNNLWDIAEVVDIKRELKNLLLDWAFTSEDILPLPIRSDHFDSRPLELDYNEGRPKVSERQSWYLQDFSSLYKNWDFDESGKLR